jgi:TRAP-type uncharacterized transport system substrate-binding protein
MFRVFVALLTTAVLAASAFTANAGQFGTRDEAVALVKRVQEKFKKEGAEATFRAINAGQFNDRDLYPFVHTIDGNLHVANGAFPGIRGKNLHDMRDQNGKFTTQDFMRIATTAPYQGWSDFRWRNPKTNTIDDKSSWIERMGEYFVGVGIYKSEQPNQNTVSIISGSPGSDATYLQVAYDLAAVLNDGENLRVLPVVGIGGPQNIRDVRGLKGIDIGLTQTSILNHFRRSNQILGVPDDDKIAIVTKLFNLEAHLVVRSGITSIEQLRGQKVNLDEVGSGTNHSMRDVFQRLDLQIEEVNMVQSQALLKLKNGEIAATVLVAGKPAQSMSRFTRADGLAFLPIPYSAALSADFLPAELTHEDYPDMIAEGQSIKTIADGAVLIAYNWPKDNERYHRVETFVNAFFSKIAEFQKPPHHPKWAEVNLNVNVEGWKRLEPAQRWLNEHFSTATLEERQRFDTYVSSQRASSTTLASQPQRQEGEALFQEFLNWKRNRIPR